ncbi:MAG: hypothetical protein IJT70_03145 [Clostridia bacterium]|nr:hypothetical protein [Clostridia bacterium]
MYFSRIIRKDGVKEATRIEAATYALEVSEDSIDVIISGERAARLSPASAVNTASGNETAFDVPGALELTEGYCGDDYVFTWKTKSSAWEEAEYVLTACETRCEYYVRVRGRAAVDGVAYFCGDVTSDRAGSEYEFDRGFTPIPTVDGASQCYFSAQRDFDEFSFLTIPPMFVYVFELCGASAKLAFALSAERGEHNFTKFAYKTRSGGLLRRFWFETDQCCHTEVDGEWKTPTVMIYGAASEKEALEYYSRYYFATGKADIKEYSKIPRFWYGPIACGWTEQAAYAYSKGINASQYDLARRDVYDNFNAELERRDLHPTLMIIDDKWQTEYGDPYADVSKWSDLRGWIDENREVRGRHTMLWFKLWASDGLPDSMCMASESEYNKRCADPTNPAYRSLLKKILRRLLSSDEGCYNADGLKLDFAFFQPVGRSAVSHSGKYGVELYLEYLKFIYTAAKEIKPEAVISASPCHPLFAPYVDHARLHDYHPDLRRCPEEFDFRSTLYRTALPWSLIDTDGAAFRSQRDTMRYMVSAPKIGIPDLYCISDMPSLSLSDDDWRCVANVWREYSGWADRISGTEA